MKLILLLLLSTTLLAAPRDNARTELYNLLKERSEKFDAYSQSLRKHSGLFGGKTKGDLRESQDQLKSIIEVDNRIMSSLNRALDYKNFEKLSYTLDTRDTDEKLKTLRLNNETLLARNQTLEDQSKVLQSELGRYRLYFVLLILSISVLVFMYVRKALR